MDLIERGQQIAQELKTLEEELGELESQKAGLEATLAEKNRAANEAAGAWQAWAQEFREAA